MGVIEQGGADIYDLAKESKQDATILAIRDIGGLVPDSYDYISASYNDGTFSETYVFKTGGAGGTTVATITVIYVDATKEKLVSVTKT
jgi:hypothetical protein